MHVNTVYYRLERISERIGTNLRSIDAVVDLTVALRMLGRGNG